MKPIDFYTAEPISTNTYLFPLESVLTDYIEEIDEVNLDNNKRITLKFYVNYVYDGGERSFEVFSVWFDNIAIMLVLSDCSGSEEFITNEFEFKKMLEYIESLRPEKEPEDEDLPVYDENQDISSLDIFNHRKIRDYYVKETVFPMFSEGDVVIAEVREDHMRDRWTSKPVMIETRCLVTKVYKHNPYETYSLKQIDRKIEQDKNGKFQIVESKDKGDIFAVGNDRTIKKLIGTSISHFFSIK